MSTTKTNTGLIIGKMCPPTKGHIYMIMEAAQRCHKLNVILCIDHIHDPKEISPEDREEILRAELCNVSNIEVHTLDCTAFPYAKEDDMEVSKYWSDVLFKMFPETGTLFGSEKYVEYMAENWPSCLGVRHEVIDLDRKAVPISATMIRESAYNNWQYVVESAKPLLTKHVLVMGSEACGKTTLVNTLGKLMKAPTVPEMYRSMFPEKGMDFKSNDLITVAQVQNNAVKCQVLSPYNKGLVIHDTCCDITLAYSKEYYPGDHEIHNAIIKERDDNECKFDLILFCDTDVAWVNDGTRTLGDPEDRKRMRDMFYSMAVQKANKNNCKLITLPPDYARLPAALEAVEAIL